MVTKDSYFCPVKKYAVIVAGGKGERMGAEVPKQFLPIAGKPVLMYTIDAFRPHCDELIVVLPETRLEFWGQLCVKHDFKTQHKMAIGGSTRFRSVYNGLKLVEEKSLVAIHDGMRPLVTQDIIERCYKLAWEDEGAIAAVALKDSIRDGRGNVDRTLFKLVQTPQTFQSRLIKDAYEFYYRIDENGAFFTDDASVFEGAGNNVTMVEGSYRNIKITTPEDLLIAEAILNN